MSSVTSSRRLTVHERQQANMLGMRGGYVVVKSAASGQAVAHIVAQPTTVIPDQPDTLLWSRKAGSSLQEFRT